jgi:4-amino-4-deoxy-L-arabinose transferase-like glycosyltransferase
MWRDCYATGPDLTAFRRVRPLHALVALQLIVIVVGGVLTATRFPFFSLIDETAHFDYVRVVAEKHRLPVLGEDKMGYPVLALNAGLDPNTRPAPHVDRPSGLGEDSYQAFEPPLYYVLVAPLFVLTDDWSARVKLVRLAGLVFLLAAAAVLYRFAGRVFPTARLLVFSLALTVLMWPGVVFRSATVSNAPLELLMAVLVLYVLWRADEERDERRLVLAGFLFGLALLTKLTLVPLAPLLLLVAFRAGRRGAWRAAAASVALPVVLLAPWLIFNLNHYDALTASSLAKEMQEATVNPGGVTYTVGRMFDMLPQLFDGVLPQDWASVAIKAPLMGLGFDFVRVAVFGLPLLLLLAEPSWLKTRHAALLVAPFVLGVLMVAYVTLFENWPIASSRRLYAELPALALFTAVSALTLFRTNRPALVLAVASTLVLTAGWVDLTTRYLV